MATTPPRPARRPTAHEPHEAVLLARAYVLAYVLTGVLACVLAYVLAYVLATMASSRLRVVYIVRKVVATTPHRTPPRLALPGG